MLPVCPALLQTLLRLLRDAVEQQLPCMGMREVASSMTSLVKLPAPINKAFFVKLIVRARQLFDEPDTTTQVCVLGVPQGRVLGFRVLVCFLCRRTEGSSFVL
jgi:hypothetical protein